MNLALKIIGLIKSVNVSKGQVPEPQTTMVLFFKIQLTLCLFLCS